MKKSLLYLLALSMFTVSAFASEEGCSDMIKKCFSEEGVKKSNCFYRASVDQSCENTQLGKLAHKRWMNSGAATTHGTQAFLGPLGVDSNCANSCDNQWLAFMIAEEPMLSTIEQVNSCLDTCKTKKAIDIPSL